MQLLYNNLPEALPRGSDEKSFTDASYAKTRHEFPRFPWDNPENYDFTRLESLFYTFVLQVVLEASSCVLLPYQVRRTSLVVGRGLEMPNICWTFSVEFAWSIQDSWKVHQFHAFSMMTWCILMYPVSNPNTVPLQCWSLLGRCKQITVLVGKCSLYQSLFTIFWRVCLVHWFIHQIQSTSQFIHWFPQSCFFCLPSQEACTSQNPRSKSQAFANEIADAATFGHRRLNCSFLSLNNTRLPKIYFKKETTVNDAE